MADTLARRACRGSYDEPVPTVLRSGPYRFFFYSGDRREPAHVHVQRDNDIAKFWLVPVSLVGSVGFSRSELRRIEDLVLGSQSMLLEIWNDFFAE